MSSVFEYDCDAVRVRARRRGSDELEAKEKSVSESVGVECRKFSIDPNLTTRDTLVTLLARAFEIESEDEMIVHFYSSNQWMPLQSDWDLDVAILTAADPFLSLLIDTHCSTERLKAVAIETTGQEEQRSGTAVLLKAPCSTNDTRTDTNDDADEGMKGSSMSFSSLIRRHVEKTLVPRVSKVLGLTSPDDHVSAPITREESRAGDVVGRHGRRALDEQTFRLCTNKVGQLVKPRELRLHVYLAGCEHSMRKVVWKHLLAIYPESNTDSSLEASEPLSARERVEFMRQRCSMYEQLKRGWLDQVLSNCVTDDLKHVMHMVKKDVRRTDRHLNNFSTENNVAIMYNILTTYAVHHPSIGYCQGMSDLLSPLVVVMADEAQAYVAFCALLQRLKPNFHVQGLEMNTKFQHLTQTILHHDPQFFAFLKSRGADDLIFCYRWLLLELKREFPFDDALKALEVLWASLPPKTHPDGVQLSETRALNRTTTLEVSSKKTTLFGNVVAMRKRISSSGDAAQVKKENRALTKAASDASSDTRTRLRSSDNTNEDDAKEERATKSAGSASSGSPWSMDEAVAGNSPKKVKSLKEFYAIANGPRAVSHEDVKHEDVKHEEGHEEGKNSNKECGCGADDSIVQTSCSEDGAVLKLNRLPPPTELGDGNPFLMFMCLALILQQRDAIMEQQLDYQEVAMYFDRMMRKHNVEITLSLARKLFADYLNKDWQAKDCGQKSKENQRSVKNC